MSRQNHRRWAIAALSADSVCSAFRASLTLFEA